MSTLSLRLPNSLHKQLRKVAREEGVSINQLISSAVGEKLAALMTVDYLKERAARGDRSRFEEALSKVPDIEASVEDRLPNRASESKASRRRSRG